MDPSQLPLDPLVQVLMNLSPRDLQTYCSSYPNINRICNSDQFMFDYLVLKYGLNLNEIPGTIREKFRLVQNLVDRVESAELTSIRESFYESALPRVYGFPYRTRVYIIPKIKSALEEAVRIGSPRLLELLFSRIKYPNRLRGEEDVIIAFLDSLRLNRPEITQVILNHYDVTQHPFVKTIYRDEIGVGDISMVESFLRYILPTPEDLRLAEDHGQEQIAMLLKSRLSNEDRLRSS